MELNKTNKKIVCDILGCKNMADYNFEFKKSIFGSNMYVCKDCLKKMYELMAKEFVPASIKNVYKKSSEIKEK